MEIQSAEVSMMMQSKAMEQQRQGARIISKTLDYINRDKRCTGSADYDFQSDVLSAAVTGKGAVINVLG